MIDRRIKFRHIQCFVEIAREQSLKAAARKLFLTQPTMSKTLKEIEDILGATLLIRNRSGVQLTPEGEIFLRFAEMSVAALQQGIDGLRQESEAGRQPLSVGVLPSVAARHIPAVAERFAATTPDVVLRIMDGPVGYLVTRLKLGELDLVIGRMGDHEQMKGVSFNLLYRERVVFVARAGHPARASNNPAEILNWPVLYPPVGAAIRPIVDRFMVEHGIGEIPRRIESVSGAFGRVFVRRSDAIWIISESVVANELEDGVLEKLPFNTDSTVGPIGIMTREDWDFTPQAKAFRRTLRETIEAERA